jgi:hypothetical protein
MSVSLRPLYCNLERKDCTAFLLYIALHTKIAQNETVIVTKNDNIHGLLEKYPTFGREKETGLPGALDT